MFVVTPEFVSFLRAAKLATYAAQGDEASVPALLPDSKQLEYAQGPYLYRDIYVGMLRFVGQETVYSGARAVWSMAYAGGLAPGVAKAEAAEVFRALRAALCETPTDTPLRGPREFEAENLRYVAAFSGDLQRFSGEESISRQGLKVYGLQFAGGGLA